MSNIRIGQIVLVKNINAHIPACYAAYAIDNTYRDDHRICSLKLIKLNRNYVNKCNLFKLNLNEFETLHKENGFYFYLNITKVYFNPNYAHFRKYISDHVTGVCIVLGDGVGPFSIYIAKKNNMVIGYQHNKACYAYSEINRRINKVNSYVQYVANIADLKLSHSLTYVSVMPFQIIKYMFKLSRMNFILHYCIISMCISKLNLLAHVCSFRYKILLTKDYSKYGYIYLLKICPLRYIE